MLYNSEMAGHFIIILSFMCPFLYLNTTLTSILHGLGKPAILFLKSDRSDAAPCFRLPGDPLIRYQGISGRHAVKPALYYCLLPCPAPSVPSALIIVPVHAGPAPRGCRHPLCLSGADSPPGGSVNPARDPFLRLHFTFFYIIMYADSSNGTTVRAVPTESCPAGLLPACPVFILQTGENAP